MANGMWPHDGQKPPSIAAKNDNPETSIVPRFCRRAMGDVAGENVATHFRTRSVATTGDPVHWTYSLILRS